MKKNAAFKTIRSSGRFETHRAGWILKDPATLIENGYIEVENGRIKGVFQGKPSHPHIDHGPGVLIPPFVNAHLHLELSALKNQVPFNSGFETWVKTLLKKRDAQSLNHLIGKAQSAVHDLKQAGIFYIADISTLDLGLEILKDSGLNGISFKEILGTDLPALTLEKKESLSFSAAGHAPHTTAPDLLKALRQKTQAAGLLFSIHVAESRDEIEFIRYKKGSWADFLASRDIDYSSWDTGNGTVINHLDNLGILGKSTLAVHLLRCSKKELDRIADTQTRVCICPRSNINLHGLLPDIQAMLSVGINPALGTDSLASCDSLDIRDEMAFVHRHYPDISVETIIAMGTLNGAKALGLENQTGTLSKGKAALFLYRHTETRNKQKLLQSIIYDT